MLASSGLSLLCMICVLLCSGNMHVLSVAQDAVRLPNWQDLWKSTSVKSKPLKNGNEIVPESDLRDPSRKIWIITTACLPWMTGTSINPLLRASYLAKDRDPGKITLMVPWLQPSDQDLAYPKDIRFKHPDEQKEFVKEWLREQKMTAAAKKLNIVFYAARYHDEYHSIFPMGDITALVPDDEADVCILEEPEHLNWFVIVGGLICCMFRGLFITLYCCCIRKP